MIDLQITQQFGKIGLDIQNVRYELRQTKPNLNVQQIPAELSLDISNPDLMIDYTPFLQSLGLGSIDFVMRTYTEGAKQEYLADLETSVQIGRRLGAIEKKEQIGDILFQATTPVERGIELQSLAPIEITYIPASVQSQAELGGVKLELDYGKVEVENFTFPSVRVFMEQEPYFKIQAVGQMFDVSK